jgi:hypothetical protein
MVNISSHRRFAEKSNYLSTTCSEKMARCN